MLLVHSIVTLAVLAKPAVCGNRETQLDARRPGIGFLTVNAADGLIVEMTPAGQ